MYTIGYVVLDVEFYDEQDYKEYGLTRFLEIYNVPKDNNGPEALFVQNKLDTTQAKESGIKHINEGYGCRINGTLSLPKVTPKTFRTPELLSSSLLAIVISFSKLRSNYLKRHP